MIFLPTAALALLAAQESNPKSKPIPGLPAQARYDFQGEVTVIGQYLPSFHSPYSGPNSLKSSGEADATETATLYLGARLLPNVEVYANPEIAWGNAPGGGSGLAGYLNGDLIGQPSNDGYPYLARGFVRWRVPMRQGRDQPVGREIVGRSPNVIAGQVPQHRLVVTAGRFAATDIFDYNSYANNARTQFLNNAFVNNLAYDYAEDSHGYDNGAAVALVNPNYAVRFGTFALPSVPGGDDLQYNLANSHSEQLELEIDPQVLRAPTPPLTVRVLGYRNVGYMGTYNNALGAAQLGQPPDLGPVRSSGTVRTGVGLNAEQALGDGGATGMFARIGWADGSVETEGFAEADQAVSAGGQISGARWKRINDNMGLAIGWSGISALHRQYLATGGQGFTLGDGALSYGAESVLEAYYLCQVTKTWQLTADVQFITNPGYNQDRGPAPVLSLRARYAF